MIRDCEKLKKMERESLAREEEEDGTFKEVKRKHHAASPPQEGTARAGDQRRWGSTNAARRGFSGGDRSRMGRPSDSPLWRAQRDPSTSRNNEGPIREKKPFFKSPIGTQPSGIHVPPASTTDVALGTSSMGNGKEREESGK